MRFLIEGAPLAFWLQQGGSPLQPFIPIILMVVIFYFVLFMPMRRKQRKLDEMLRNLKNGDKVVTTGGIIGILVAVGDKSTVTMRTKPDNVKLEVSRNAVSASVSDQEEKVERIHTHIRRPSAWDEVVEKIGSHVERTKKLFTGTQKREGPRNSKSKEKG